MKEPLSLDQYIEIGAVNIEGVDNNGEIIFSVSEKAKDIAPNLWAIHTKHVDEMLVELYEKDLISVEYNEDLEAMITLSEEGKEAAKELGLIPMEDK